MPTRTPHLCPRCRAIIRGDCPTCRPAQHADHDRHRPTPAARGYDSHWRRAIRPAYLRAHPLCALCGALARVPDHWPVKRADLIAAGCPDPDTFDRLRPLCLTCHARHGER